MKCQWQELLNLLPVWLRQAVDEQGKEDMQELRLRLNSPPEIVKHSQSIWLNRCINADDLSFCLNIATRYSPWTSGSITDGFITAAGGHRIGLCGECVYNGGKLENIVSLSSICIRVARVITDVSADIHKDSGSILIIGSPGSGKTTFLRDLVCKISNHSNGAVVVLDERRELFPCSSGRFFFERGRRTDVLSGCKKQAALEMAVRTMGPSVIAVDEITNLEDCTALSYAAWCGVRLLATAHATSRQDLYRRKIFQPILESNIFHTLVTIHPDKTWHKEGMEQWD